MSAAEVTAADEHRHEPDPADPLWNESWYFDWTTSDGQLGGYVRAGLLPNRGVTWYWACLVGEGRPLVIVVDHHVPLPKQGSLELRASGLWADHVAEAPLEHWTLGLEAFALSLEHPADALDPEPRGDRVPFGFELDWETDGGVYGYPGVTRYEVPCRVHGQVVVGDERIDVDGHGERDHSWGHRDWWQFGWTWTSGRLEDATAFHAVHLGIDGLAFEPGFLREPGQGMRPINGFTVETVLGAHDLPIESRMQLDALDLHVRPVHVAPVRLESPDARVSRFVRALCRFDEARGRTGYGWTEWNQPQPA